MDNGKVARLLTLQEAAERLRIKESTAYNMTCRGTFPVKVKRICGGRLIRVDERDLEAYINSL